MTSKPLHVRLEIAVDSEHPERCGGDCRGRGFGPRGARAYHEPPNPVAFYCDMFGDLAVYFDQDDDENFAACRSALCLAASKADALNAAVVEAHQRLETWLSAHPWRELGLCVAEMNDGTHFEAKLWSVRAVKGPTLERAITRALNTFEHEEAVDAKRSAEQKETKR